MKSVTLTELKNNFGKLMSLVKSGTTSLLVFERDTPIIKVIYAGDSNADEDLSIARLERSGLLQRAASPKPLTREELRERRTKPKAKRANAVAALLKNREEDR